MCADTIDKNNDDKFNDKSRICFIPLVKQAQQKVEEKKSKWTKTKTKTKAFKRK